MSLTNRNIASLLIALLAGIALWVLPDHVRGDNLLFGMNGTLLPALAIALILGFSLLDLVLNILFSLRSDDNRQALKDDDVVLDRAGGYGLLLVALAACLFTFGLPWVGYLPASLALILALMFGTGGRNLVPVFAVSLAAVGILYLGLRFGLRVHLQIWPDLILWTG